MDSESNEKNINQTSFKSFMETTDFEESTQFSSSSENNCRNDSELTEHFSTLEFEEEEEFQDASLFFKNECHMEYLENIRTSNPNSWLTRDSLGRNFDPLFETYGQPMHLNSVVETKTACTLDSELDVSETTLTRTESFNPEEETINSAADKTLTFINEEESTDVAADKTFTNEEETTDRVADKTLSFINEEETTVCAAEKTLSFINEEIFLPTRESIGNLIKFGSPQKNSIKNVEFSCSSLILSEPVMYTEKELKVILKRQELAIEAANLMKDFKLESEKLLEKEDNKSTLLICLKQSLSLVLQNFSILIQNLFTENALLEERNEELQSLKQTKTDYPKATSENFQSSDIEFSNSLESYEQAKELLNSYKTSENLLLIEVQTLQEKLLTLEEKYKSLQLISQHLEEANPEDPEYTNSYVTALQELLKKTNRIELSLENELEKARDKNRKLNIIKDVLIKIESS